MVPVRGRLWAEETMKRLWKQPKRRKWAIKNPLKS